MLIFSGHLQQIFAWPSENWRSGTSDHEKNEEEEEHERNLKKGNTRSILMTG